MEITEKDLVKLLMQLDLEVKDKIKLEDVICRLQNQFNIVDINSFERCAIKKILDNFIKVKRRKYQERRLKVDYAEMCNNASLEVVIDRVVRPMIEERPPQNQFEMEVDELNNEDTYKSLEDLETWKQQKRRTQDIFDLVQNAAIKENVSVDQLLGLMLKRSTSKVNRAIGDALWNECAKPPVPTVPDETMLAIYMDSSLGRRTYTNQRKLVNDVGYKIFPPWKHLRQKMSLITPVGLSLQHPNTGVYFPLIDSIQITVSRILTNMDLHNENLNFQIKYGFDGSGGHSIFNQLNNVSTNNIIIAMFCPLSISNDQGEVVWVQDAPNVSTSQRPLLIQMGKESKETLQSLKLFEKDITKLTEEGTVVANNNVKLMIQGHMLDRKAADIYTGLGGSYCDLCMYSKEECLQRDLVETGFEITRNIESLNQIFNELRDDSGGILKSRGDYAIRAGVTNEPIAEHDVSSFQVLHGLLRTFDHYMNTAVHVIAGVYQWSVGKTSIYNQFLCDKKKALQSKIEEETGLRWDQADAAGNNGTSTTGNTARRLLFDKKVREKVITEEIPENYRQRMMIYGSYLSITLRVISCKKKVNVYEFKKLCREFYLFLLDAFPREVHKELPGPWISITPTLHKVIGHSWELIERNDGYGLGVLDESGMEACNKVLRNIRQRLSRKCSQNANLTDIINRLWVMSDPGVNAERCKAKPFCQLCHLRGHSTRYCWRKFSSRCLDDEDNLVNALTIE